MIFNTASRFSDLRFDAAGAGETPAAQGFVDGEQSGDDKNQSEPQHIIHEDDASDEAKRPDDTARDAPVPLDVGAKEFAHGGKSSTAAPRGKLRGKQAMSGFGGASGLGSRCKPWV